ncbi:MAG: GDSL-type esterase/lipase family protein [Candidatus Obscuribacterales bacterium]
MSSDSQRKGDSCHEGRDTGSISVNSNLMHEISELRRNQSARGQCAQTQESPDNRPNTLAYLPYLHLYSGNDQHSSTDDEHHRHHDDEHHPDRDGQHRHHDDEHHSDRDGHHRHHHRHEHGEHGEHHHGHRHQHHAHNHPSQDGNDNNSSASQPDKPPVGQPSDSNNEQTTNPPETSPSTQTSLGSHIYSDGPSYYVSPNGDDKADGSKEHPFATLKRAALAMENSSIKTTTVEAGNYKMQETLHLTQKDDGVTFQFDKASGPNQAVFDGGNSIDRMIDIEGGSHITINGLRLTNFKWTGIFNHGGTVDHRDKSSQNVGSASGNRFVNNEIDHNSQTGDWTVGATGVSAAIVNDQVTPDTLVANNYIHDLQYMGIQAGRSSDLSAAAGDYSGTVISGNVIDHVMQGRHDGGAIYLWNARKQISGGEIIENNFITNYSSSTLGDGKGIYLDDGASNTIVRGNVISETDPQKSTSEAIFIHGGINNTITNNLIDLGDSGKIAALGYASSPLHPGGMTGNVFENNVIVSDFKGNQQTSGMGVTGYTYLNGYGNAARGANPQIKNNIYHNYAGGQERTDGNGIGDSSPIHETPNQIPLEGNWGPLGYSLPADRKAALQETNSSPIAETSPSPSNSANGSPSETLDFTPLPYAESAATIAVLPVNQIQTHVDENNKYNNQAKAGGIKKLFVGDSLTELQPADTFQQNFGTDAAKFGVGGDKTQNLLYRLKNGELDFPANDQPKVVVMEIGTNNIGNTTASQILDGIKANIDTIKSKLPHTKILLEGIYPRGTSMTPASIVALNTEIAKLADNKSIYYTNAGGEKLLNADGSVNTSLFRSDHVHPNAQGYAILDAALAPIVDELAAS